MSIRPEMRNARVTSSSASMRPVRMTGSPAALFSTVRARTGRTFSVAVGTFGSQAARKTAVANTAGDSHERDAFALPRTDTRADMSLLLLRPCAEWSRRPSDQRHRSVRPCCVVSCLPIRRNPDGISGIALTTRLFPQAKGCTRQGHAGPRPCGDRGGGPGSPWASLLDQNDPNAEPRTMTATRARRAPTMPTTTMSR